MAQANLSFCKLHQKSFKEAFDSARLALEMAEKLYTKESPNVSKYVKLLLSVLIRSNDIGRAERFLKTSEKYFTKVELALFYAGFKFSSGLFTEAANVLTLYETSRSNTLNNTSSSSSSSSSSSRAVECVDPYSVLLEKPFHEIEVDYNLGILSSALKMEEIGEQKLLSVIENLNQICDDGPIDQKFLNRAKFVDPNEINSSPNITREYAMASLTALSHTICTVAEFQIFKPDVGMGLRIQRGEIMSQNYPHNVNGLNFILKEIKSNLSDSIKIVSEGNVVTRSNRHHSFYDESFYSLDSESVENGSITENISLEENSIQSNENENENEELDAEEEGKDDKENEESEDKDKENEENKQNKVEEIDAKADENNEKEVDQTVEKSNYPEALPIIASKEEEDDPLVDGKIELNYDNANTIHPRNSESMLAKNLATSYINLLHLSSKKETHSNKSVADRLKKNFGLDVPERAADKLKRLKNAETKKQRKGKRGDKDKDRSAALDTTTTTTSNSVVTQIPAARADLCTIRSDILPMSSKLSPDESEYWLEWALTATKGLGFGMFCHAGHWDNDVPYDYLREIRSKLVDCEPKDLSTKLAISAVVAKLSMQLRLKNDCEKYVEDFESLAKVRFVHQI